MQEMSSADFLRMQEQAIKRVKQMQKRSTSLQNKPEQKNNIETNKKEEHGEADMKIYKKNSNSPQTNESQQKREKYEETRNNEHIEEKAISGDTIKINLPPKESIKQDKSPLSAFLSMDNDMALILPLVLLLGKEGADDILLLALLYILS